MDKKDNYLDPFRYTIFRKTSRDRKLRLIFIFIYGLISIIIITIFSLINDLNLLLKPELLIFFMLMPLYFAIDFIRYLFFRGWIKRLPFKLSGWSELAGVKKFDRIFWRDNCKISVIIETPEELQLKSVKTALSKFVKIANKKFYAADSESSVKSARRKTFSHNELNASGSANSEIIGLIIRLISGELSKIAKKTKNLTEIILSIDHTSYPVMPYIPTGPDAS